MEGQRIPPPFLIGTRILLRPLCEADVNDRYLSWLNDREVTRHMETGTFPVTAKGLREFYESITKSESDVIFAIIAKEPGLHIGNIKLGGINWIHRFGDLGIMIGDKEYWNKGHGKEACKLLLRFAFENLNLRIVTLGVYGNHIAGAKAYEKIGFQIDGRIKGYFNCHGEYVDKVIMSISKERFLALRDNWSLADATAG